ncbi:non-specific lipid-transfer protein 4-like isoform 2 [Hibiscus syriacus]|uniref:Non-specific lipid-transfer protein 4-like isoform 2 n=1 Tax=Hibiscus syriacus TaxID=106335 RepID=A0A6A3BGE4_HIBSY|nr:non-specific lipid-transfer protein 4-like isoform 2 [Hibiscus syriacus]
MGVGLKPYFLVALFVFGISSVMCANKIEAAGECGKTPIRSAAVSLSPCLGTAGNAKVKVPPGCCSKVGALLKASPRCLCAILLSPLAKQAGINPGIAIGIPKRCNIRNRQSGKKCGSK